jgi:transposase
VIAVALVGIVAQQAIPGATAQPGNTCSQEGESLRRAFREYIWSIGTRPAIPHQRHEAQVACPDWIYNNRNVVERLWARLKEWRTVATRYVKIARSFMGVLCLEAALDWLKR